MTQRCLVFCVKPDLIINSFPGPIFVLEVSCIFGTGSCGCLLLASSRKFLALGLVLKLLGLGSCVLACMHSPAAAAAQLRNLED